MMSPGFIILKIMNLGFVISTYLSCAPACILNPDDNDVACVSEVLMISVLSIVFIFCGSRSTSKFPNVHFQFGPPNPSIRACHQHPPLSFREENVWRLCLCERKCKGRLNGHVNFGDDAIVQQVSV